MISNSLSVVNNLLPIEVIAAAAAGWKLFPMAAGTKMPLVKWGTTEPACSDIDQLTRWAMKYPGCNWGCATGSTSGFFVVDPDDIEGWMWTIGKGLPTTHAVKTGKNDFAYHYYFKQPAGMRVRNSQKKIHPGVDVRGDGGLVVIPPSLHHSGNCYQIEATGAWQLAEAPRWLIELVKDTTPERIAIDLSNLPPLTPDQMKFGENIFRKLCREFAALPGGTGIRNAEMNKLGFSAGGFIASGCFDAEFAEQEVREAAAEYISQDGEREVMRTFQSGLNAGIGSPWVPEEKSPEDAGFGQSPLPDGASLTAPAGTPHLELKGVDASLLMLKTQDSVAQIFERQQVGKLLFNHSRGKWMEWDGMRWRIETTEKAFSFVRDLARSVNFGGASSLGSAAFCGGVEKFVQASRVFAVEGGEFDCDNYLLNTPAGTLDLRTGELRQHEPKDRITHCTAVAPSTASGAVFEKFLTEITLGDRELSEFLQVSLGACLSGAIEDHWMLFWVGQGRNGKNSLGDLIEDVMGDYAVKIQASTLMAKSFESHPAEIAQLQGTRIAISSEINDGDFWHEARIKELTGDATLRARFMRENFFSFQRTHKHLVYGNCRPQLRSVANAIKSRIKIVPFKASFIGREDKDLPRRLREDLGYVLAWLIEGHTKWLASGKNLPQCAAVEAESLDYFASQSTPEMWLAERCESVIMDDRPHMQLPRSTDLYRDYSDWKKRRGEQPVSQTRWAEVMRGSEKVKTTLGVHYKGLRLLPMQFGDVPFPVVANVAPAPKVVAN